jgi:hypothetical protein
MIFKIFKHFLLTDEKDRLKMNQQLNIAKTFEKEE